MKGSASPIPTQPGLRQTQSREVGVVGVGNDDSSAVRLKNTRLGSFLTVSHHVTSVHRPILDACEFRKVPVPPSAVGVRSLGLMSPDNLDLDSDGHTLWEFLFGIDEPLSDLSEEDCSVGSGRKGRRKR